MERLQLSVPVSAASPPLDIVGGDEDFRRVRVHVVDFGRRYERASRAFKPFQSGAFLGVATTLTPCSDKRLEDAVGMWRPLGARAIRDVGGDSSADEVLPGNRKHA
jgi:hypothetical protein